MSRICGFDCWARPHGSFAFTIDFFNHCFTIKKNTPLVKSSFKKVRIRIEGCNHINVGFFCRMSSLKQSKGRGRFPKRTHSSPEDSFERLSKLGIIAECLGQLALYCEVNYKVSAPILGHYQKNFTLVPIDSPKNHFSIILSYCVDEGGDRTCSSSKMEAMIAHSSRCFLNLFISL